MAIQPASHNTILVSSRPGRRAGGYTVKIPSPGPKLLATFRNRFMQSRNRSIARASQLCDFRMVLESWTG
ncbi:hypothetical protein ACVI1J_008704 [Bradyrhizobium diazoefficiens]